MTGLVWYVCYGSNLNRERFNYYIQGGTMPANRRTYTGCRDTTPPRQVQKVTLHHELYFAKHSRTWGGGVAFIDTEESEEAMTRGLAYLVTTEQFADIVSQENLLDRAIQVPIEVVTGQHIYTMPKLGWYDTLIYLGDIDGAPSVTFTAATRDEATQPSASYLAQIAQGLHQEYHMTAQQTAEYLIQS